VGCLTTKDDFNYVTSKELPLTFPNGYNAFYCMKYEVTQGQYVDFLNSLTRPQQENRCRVTTVGNYMSGTAGGHDTPQSRNTVQLVEDQDDLLPRVFATVTPDCACNWILWPDLAAFADWSGLRPMTELEFEKACRGPLKPVPNEYAWGTSVSTKISDLIGEDGSGSETYTTGNGHWSGNGGPSGPIRVGIFAVPDATREQAGASYWGILEMSGNVWERAISVGNATARKFTGLHGGGVLLADGMSSVTDWPQSSGVGYRGGIWQYAASYARLSSRLAATHLYSVVVSNSGGRAVRSAP
jgi:formylglycine-generating enzyme required for sulfatase activity